MSFLTSALISLPLSKEDARSLGIIGTTVAEQCTAMEIKLKSKGYEARVGDRGLKWHEEGAHYIYVRTSAARQATSVHSFLEKLGGMLDNGIIIPTTWQIRPNEKSLDYPPEKKEMLALTKK